MQRYGAYLDSHVLPHLNSDLFIIEPTMPQIVNLGIKVTCKLVIFVSMNTNELVYTRAMLRGLRKAAMLREMPMEKSW